MQIKRVCALALLALITGCGQKGALLLVEPPSEAPKVKQAQPAEDEAAEKGSQQEQRP